MSLEKEIKNEHLRVVETQLEFPFLDEIRMQLYAEKQYKHMKDLYNLSYRFDGDNGQEMTFTDFVQGVWVKGGLAAQYRITHGPKYFYDAEWYKSPK